MRQDDALPQRVNTDKMQPAKLSQIGPIGPTGACAIMAGPVSGFDCPTLAVKVNVGSRPEFQMCASIVLGFEQNSAHASISRRRLSNRSPRRYAASTLSL